jgi:hypothetical protein
MAPGHNNNTAKSVHGPSVQGFHNGNSAHNPSDLSLGMERMHPPSIKSVLAGPRIVVGQDPFFGLREKPLLPIFLFLTNSNQCAQDDLNAKEKKSPDLAVQTASPVAIQAKFFQRDRFGFY